MRLRVLLASLLFISSAFAQNALVVSGNATYTAGESRQLTQTTDGALRVTCN